MKKYFYAKNGERLGPYTAEEILAKNLDNNTLVWYEGLADWVKLSNAPELSSLVKSTPPPPPLTKSVNKSKLSLATFVLLIIGGSLIAGGVFYYPKWASTQKYNKALSVFMSTDSIQFAVFNELAIKNFDEAQYILGLYYQRTDDSLKAKEAFEKALQTSKKIPALYGLLDVNRKDSTEYKKNLSAEFAGWVNRIEKDDWLSQKIAAKMCASGIIGKTDYSRAKEFYEKSINNGSVASMILLGDLYSQDGDLKDEAKSLELYKKAASLGNAHAMSATGFIYYEGSGVKKDYIEARKWFLKGAQNNSAYGEMCMGMLYMAGDGVKQRSDSAKYWFDRASKNRLDKSELSQYFKKAAQPLALTVEAIMKSSTASGNTQTRSSSSGGSNSFNKYIACNYCGRGFYQRQGFAKAIGIDCAASWNEQINDIAIAYNAGYPVENLQYLVNSYERGEWYCTRKCVYESGNCLK